MLTNATVGGAIATCTLALLASVAEAPLEAQAVRATILGIVQDTSGAAMPGATVEVRNVDTGVTQTVITNGQGRYNAPDLAIGTYEVRASLAGLPTGVHTGLTPPRRRAKR